MRKKIFSLLLFLLTVCPGNKFLEADGYYEWSDAPFPRSLGTNYPDVSFAAIVINSPVGDKENCETVVKVLYLIKDSLKSHKFGDEIRISKCLKEYEYNYPMYMFADYEKKKLRTPVFFDTKEYIVTPKAIFPLERGGFLKYDHIVPICNLPKHYLRFALAPIHSFYTPYFNPLKNHRVFVDSLYYLIEDYFAAIGKNNREKNDFLKKLAQNRKVVTHNQTNAKYIALGFIRRMEQIEENEESYCRINFAPNFIFRDGKKHYNSKGTEEFSLEANIRANGYRWHFRASGGNPVFDVLAKKKGSCFLATKTYLQDYIFGSYEEGLLVIDSTLSSWDYFYHDGDLVDLTMGYPFDDFISNFLPKELSLEDLTLNRIVDFFQFLYKELSPDQIRKIEAANKKVDKYCREQEQLLNKSIK